MTRPARVGFNLIELLVVLAIIGILVGLLLPTTADRSTRSAVGNDGSSGTRTPYIRPFSSPADGYE